MTRRQRKIHHLERRWRDRFGEPPTLRTDPELMRRILDDDERGRALSNGAAGETARTPRS